MMPAVLYYILCIYSLCISTVKCYKNLVSEQFLAADNGRAKFCVSDGKLVSDQSCSLIHF
jgi:hypothetical protein